MSFDGTTGAQLTHPIPGQRCSIPGCPAGRPGWLPIGQHCKVPLEGLATARKERAEYKKRNKVRLHQSLVMRRRAVSRTRRAISSSYAAAVAAAAAQVFLNYRSQCSVGVLASIFSSFINWNQTTRGVICREKAGWGQFPPRIGGTWVYILYNHSIP